MKYTLGSLFDGSGGFPLAGSLCGITPKWAAEIEPYPIAVTRSRFPDMKHLGDISKVNGYEIEPVDIITFGSPCQDLSIAGKRAGLKHEANGDEETTRSGLFMEAVRIIKEMRCKTNGKYPRFALWENVPGAFSSNKGEDFRIVLEELIKIVEPEAVMPAVPAKGWAYADSYIGDGWSLAYRVFDAQYWGVPQRRRRIHLVLDLRGERARKVLFEREGLRGYFAEGGTTWQGAAGDAESGIGADDREGNCLTPWDYQSKRVYSVDGVFPTPSSAENSGQQQQAVCLSVMDIPENCKYNADGYCKKIRGDSLPFLPYCVPYTQPCVLEASGFKAGQGAKARSIGWEDGKRPTLAADAGGNSVPSVCVKCYDDRGNGDSQTVNTMTGDHESRITDYTSVVVEKKPVYCLQGNGIDRDDTAGCNGKGWKEDAGYTLNTIDRHAVAYATDVGFLNTLENQSPTLLARGYKDPHLISYQETQVRYIVRRLTPTECARLQGFPDDWAHPDHKEDLSDEEYRFWLDVRNTYAAINGKPQKDYTKAQMLTWYNKLHTDSSEYKMWGNGISLPTALYVMQGIAEECQ